MKPRIFDNCLYNGHHSFQILFLCTIRNANCFSSMILILIIRTFYFLDQILRGLVRLSIVLQLLVNVYAKRKDDDKKCIISETME